MLLALLLLFFFIGLSCGAWCILLPAWQSLAPGQSPGHRGGAVLFAVWRHIRCRGCDQVSRTSEVRVHPGHI